MGRGCTMDEWVHFQKLPEEGRVPHSSYWYVMCRHCALGFEQKQLPNAPSKLTGRRSAMRAHLKVCPMYGAHYILEQKAKTEVGAASDATDAPSSGEKRKRRADGESTGAKGGRGKHCMMEEWEHFDRLQDEGYIGKSNFFYAVCKYCEQAYDEASDEQKPLLVPKKLVGRREKMRKHLSLCPHFKGELPPLERRIHRRSAGIPHNASLLAAKAAAHAATTDGTTEPTPDEVLTTRVAVGSTATARMMLNEWQYFTRMERKKDSAYYNALCNFCHQAYENAPEGMKASMEPTVVTGRKSNMQTHLARCPHIPNDLSFARTDDDGLNQSTTVEAVQPSEASVPLPAKRAKVDMPRITHGPSPDVSTVNRALVEILLEHHLPFEWVESSSVKKLFRALVPMTDVGKSLMPSTTDLRTRVLDELHGATLLSELTRLQAFVPHELSASAFSADVTDSLADAPATSWPVMLHCNVTMSHSQAGASLLPTIKGIVTNGRALVPLSYVRDQNSKVNIDAAVNHNHGLEIARWLDEHLRLCVDTAKLSPAAVVMPFNSITQRAVAILRAPTQWPQVRYLANVEDLFQFPLLKLLATAEMFGVVSSLIELWQLESIRICVMERLAEISGGESSSPFRDWQSCATLIEVFLDDKTFEVSTKRGAANVKRLVDSALNRPLLERVHVLLRCFMNAFSSCREGLTLSETLVHLKALFNAADGIVTVQHALEVVWVEMEQPLFVLAHALSPHLRLRDLSSTEITKLSALSDVSVAYFRSIFGRKPTSLRGEVTAYLHTSQHSFTDDVISEFPVVDDYFRYLSDNYPSLSMLMQVLHSFSPVFNMSHTTHRARELTKKRIYNTFSYKDEEKLEYLRSRWDIASGTPLMETEEHTTKIRIATHNKRSGAAMLNAGVVVDEWKETLGNKLHTRGVDFALLEANFEGVDDSEIVVATDTATASEQSVVHRPKLPTLTLDDELTYPSFPLRDPFSKKVLLKHLFKTVEATI